MHRRLYALAIPLLLFFVLAVRHESGRGAAPRDVVLEPVHARPPDRIRATPAVSPVVRTELWVALIGGGAVAVVDAETAEELARIRVGESPTYVKVSPNGQWAAVANSASNTVSVIRTADLTVVRTLDTGRVPKGVNWTPDSGQLWVVNEGEVPGTVRVFSVPGFRPLGDVVVQAAPHNVVLTQDGTTAYVTNTGSGTVSVVDVGGLAVRDTILVGGAVHNLTLEPGDARLFVTRTDRQQVAVVRTANGVVADSIPVVVGHHVPAVDGAGHLVVGGFGGGAASVVALGERGRGWTPLGTVALAAGAHGVAFGPDKTAFVTSLVGDYVAEVDLREEPRRLRTLPVPGAPFTVSIRLVLGDGRSTGARSGSAS